MALFSPLQPDKETLCGSGKHLSALDILLGPEEVSQEPMSHGNELKSYMKEKPIPRNEDILSWWKANEHRYKQVANVAKEILCAPSTSAPAEQLFSITGLMINRLCSSMNPDSRCFNFFKQKFSSVLWD